MVKLHGCHPTIVKGFQRIMSEPIETPMNMGGMTMPLGNEVMKLDHDHTSQLILAVAQPVMLDSRRTYATSDPCGQDNNCINTSGIMWDPQE